MNCLECKHLIYDKTEYTKLRLNNNTNTEFTSYCYPIPGMLSPKHSIDFLLHKREHVHSRIKNCKNFEPCP